jgi:copper chaperone CopZ/predicted peroxiredoxin
MTCQGCAQTVTAAVKAIPGVADVEVSLEDGQAVVVAGAEEFSAPAVIAAIEEAGYKASLADGDNADPDEPPRPAAKRGVLVNITRGENDLHAVSMAVALAQRTLDDGRRCAVFLNVAAPVFAAKDLSEEVKYADFPPVKEMLAQFVADGGQLYVCEHCAHVCRLEKDDLIEGVTLSRQTELFAEIDRDMAVFSC